MGPLIESLLVILRSSIEGNSTVATLLHSFYNIENISVGNIFILFFDITIEELLE
jgi:hypothetical protein